MAAILVTHVNLDMDAVCSLRAAQIAITQSYEGEIKFAFIAQGKTYHGITVDPTQAFQMYKGDRVFHIDTGLGLLDHHRRGSQVQSSLRLVCDFFHLGSEWERLINWVEADELAKTNGGLNLAQALRGANRQKMPVEEMLGHAFWVIDNTLYNEGIQVQQRGIPIERTDSIVSTPLPDPLDVTSTYLRVSKTGIGVAICPLEEQRGTNHYKLFKDCSIVVSIAAATGDISILTQQLDLGELMIPRLIRHAEAQVRGLNLTEGQLETLNSEGGVPIDGLRGWYAFDPEHTNKTIKGLLNGSPKATLPASERTKLSLGTIASIVENALIDSHGEAQRVKPKNPAVKEIELKSWDQAATVNHEQMLEEYLVVVVRCGDQYRIYGNDLASVADAIWTAEVVKGGYYLTWRGQTKKIDGPVIALLCDVEDSVLSWGEVMEAILKTI